MCCTDRVNLSIKKTETTKVSLEVNDTLREWRRRAYAECNTSCPLFMCVNVGRMHETNNPVGNRKFLMIIMLFRRTHQITKRNDE